MLWSLHCKEVQTLFILLHNIYNNKYIYLWNFIFTPMKQQQQNRHLLNDFKALGSVTESLMISNHKINIHVTFLYYLVSYFLKVGLYSCTWSIPQKVQLFEEARFLSMQSLSQSVYFPVLNNNASLIANTLWPNRHSMCCGYTLLKNSEKTWSRAKKGKISC